MKKIFLVGVLLSISCNIFAEDKMTKSDAIEGICSATAKYAEAVMTGRQNGMKITESIANINKTLKAGPMKDYYKAIAYEAYEEPKWSTKENQENAVTEFSNKTYLTCAKVFEKELSDIE